MPLPRILIGYDQGAQVAVEQLGWRPEGLCGVIAMSPDYNGPVGPEAWWGPPSLPPGKRAVVVVGDRETAQRPLAKADVRWLRGLGAEVMFRESLDQRGHHLPRDADSLGPVWLDWVRAGCAAQRPPR